MVVSRFFRTFISQIQNCSVLRKGDFFTELLFAVEYLKFSPREGALHKAETQKAASRVLDISQERTQRLIGWLFIAVR